MGDKMLSGVTMPALMLCMLLLFGLAACGGESDTTVAEPLTVIVPSPTPQYTVTVERDIVYGQGEVNNGGSFKNLLLDLYIPDEFTHSTAKQFPLMLMLHGGSYKVGSKENPILVASAQEYARRGWLVASINYRLESDNPVSSARVKPLYDVVGGASASLGNLTIVAAVDDVITALEFLDARDDVYMPWTTMWGASAGASLALISGYSLDDYGMTPLGVAAVVDISGSIYDAYIGTPFDDPVGADPALMIIHSVDDPVVPFDRAAELQAFAIEAGLPFELEAIENYGHTFDLLTTYSSTGATLFQRTVDYLHETVFAGQEPGPLVIR
jgi:para-nitrobenzyl esterase